MKWYQVKFIKTDNSLYRVEFFGKKYFESFYDFIARIKRRGEEIFPGETAIDDIKRIH